MLQEKTLYWKDDLLFILANLLTICMGFFHCSGDNFSLTLVGGQLVSGAREISFHAIFWNFLGVVLSC